MLKTFDKSSLAFPERYFFSDVPEILCVAYILVTKAKFGRIQQV